MLGVVDQRHGEFEQFLLAEREIAGGDVALAGEADKVEQLGALPVGVPPARGETDRQTMRA